MAPEQFDGRVSASSDTYAMGVIAYEMLTGKRPFNPDLPYQLSHLNGGSQDTSEELRPGSPTPPRMQSLERFLSILNNDIPERVISAKLSNKR